MRNSQYLIGLDTFLSVCGITRSNHRIINRQISIIALFTGSTISGFLVIEVFPENESLSVDSQPTLRNRR